MIKAASVDGSFVLMHDIVVKNISVKVFVNVNDSLVVNGKMLIVI